jgi:hypothetical protein
VIRKDSWGRFNVQFNILRRVLFALPSWTSSSTWVHAKRDPSLLTGHLTSASASGSRSSVPALVTTGANTSTPTHVCCRHPSPTAALPRADLGGLLRSMGLRGAAVELGTRDGKFSHIVLSQWRQCALYVQVDAWMHLDNYLDTSNAEDGIQGERRRQAYRYLLQAVNASHLGRGVQCANLTSVCARRFVDGTFDFIYVDARHDRLGVLEDLHTWWPKLRRGGLMAGHDYTEQVEPRSSWVYLDSPKMYKTTPDPQNGHQNWKCA